MKNRGKDSSKDRQLAMEYIIFMMVGSYFRKAKPCFGVRGKQMAICYHLLKPGQQERWEREVEEHFVRDVLPHLDNGFLDEEVRVTRVPLKNPGVTALAFTAGGRSLLVWERYGR